MSSSQSQITSIVHLPTFPRAAHAQTMLRQVASLVKPIMRSRNLRISSLAEFFPAEKNLLGINVNSGEKICLRLRQPWDKGTFLDVEECVFIMLHELAHNTYGPHDDKFYSHLKALEEEYTALRASGYAGEGFYSEGRRLGSSTSASSQNPRLSDARKKALAAANARRKAHIGGPPQKLGGNGNGAPGASIREKIAAATERRIRDAQTCGAGSKAGDRGRLEREAEDAIRAGTATTVIEIEDDEETEKAIIQAAIDLIAEAEREEALQRALWEEKEDGVVWIVDDDVPIQVELPTTQTQPPPPPTQTQPQPQAQPPPQLDLPPSYEEATTPIPTPIPTPTQIQPQTWECEMCTLINPTDLIRCEVCSFERDLFTPPPPPPTSSLPPPPPLSLPLPPPPKKQKVRFAGSPVVIPEKRILVKQKRETWWTCENCTLRNEADWWTCCACGVMKLTS